MNYKAKKLWKGSVSVRDYIVEKAISRNKPLTVEYNNDKMTIEVGRLKEGKLNRGILTSKYGHQSYRLIDFKWEPNCEGQTQLF